METANAMNNDVDPMLAEATERLLRQDPGAIDLLKQLADRGNGEALFLLGAIYREGKIVPADADVAVDFYERAAKAGNREAQCDLGWMLLVGDGIQVDLARGTALLLKSAAQQDSTAWANLARFYPPTFGARSLIITVACGLLFSIIFLECSYHSSFAGIFGVLFGLVAGFIFCRIRKMDINFPRLFWALTLCLASSLIISFLPFSTNLVLVVPLAGIVIGWAFGFAFSKACNPNFLARIAEFALPRR